MDEPVAGAGSLPISRRKGLIVLGMHRSGTSVLTNILDELGFHVGDAQELTAANWENPKGFFERRDMRVLCDRMLHAAGADWWKVADFNASALGSAFLTGALNDFRTIVAGLDARGSWATKEPRLCILFPLLAAVLTEPAVVVMARHPLEVAKSLRRRNGIPTVAGLALWEVYTCSALRASARLPRSIVLHHELLADPAGSVEALQRDLGAMGFSLAPGVRAASAVVDPGLRRSVIDGRDPDAALSPHQRALWEALCARQPLDDGLLTVSDPAREILREFEADEAEKLERLAALRTRRTAEFAALEDIIVLGRARHAATMEALQQSRRDHAAAMVELERLQRRDAAAKVLEKQVSDLQQQNRARKKRVSRLERDNRTAEELLQQAFFVDRREMRRILRFAIARIRYRLCQRGVYRWLPEASRNRRDERTIRDSVFFRADWYAQQYLGPRSRLAPLAHFVAHGWRQGNNPSPYFDTAWYLARHPDVAASGLNPLVHFLRVGGRVGALPGPNASLLACVRNASRKRGIPLDVAELLAAQIRERHRQGKKAREKDEAAPDGQTDAGDPAGPRKPPRKRKGASRPERNHLQAG